MSIDPIEDIVATYGETIKVTCTAGNGQPETEFFTWHVNDEEPDERQIGPVVPLKDTEDEFGFRSVQQTLTWKAPDRSDLVLIECSSYQELCNENVCESVTSAREGIWVSIRPPEDDHSSRYSTKSKKTKKPKRSKKSTTKATQTFYDPQTGIGIDMNAVWLLIFLIFGSFMAFVAVLYLCKVFGTRNVERREPEEVQEELEDELELLNREFGSEISLIFDSESSEWDEEEEKTGSEPEVEDETSYSEESEANELPTFEQTVQVPKNCPICLRSGKKKKIYSCRKCGQWICKKCTRKLLQIQCPMCKCNLALYPLQRNKALERILSQ